jgi:hypothetical protein
MRRYWHLGRIYKELIHATPMWRWILQADPAQPPNQGIAESLEEAEADLQETLPRGLRKVAPGRGKPSRQQLLCAIGSSCPSAHQ